MLYILALICYNTIMKHNYMIKHKTSLRIMFTLLLIIVLIGLIVNTITLIKNVKLEANIAFTLSWTVLLAVQLAALLFLIFNCRYTVSDKHFTLIFGLIFKKIPIANLKLIRQDKVNETILLYYRIARKGEELIDYQSININPKYFDDFINDLKGKNPSIIYENFDIYRQSEE